MKINNLKKAILGAEKIAVVSHKKPDGDAVSSLMALVLALLRLDKKVVAFSKSDLFAKFPFLPGVLFAENGFDPNKFDLILLLDHNVLSRGEFETELENSRTPFYIIDHHPPGLDARTEAAYIDPKAASTTEVLYDVLKSFGLEMDKQIATCLLTGLVTDTNSFQNPNTTQKSLDIAAELLGRGANLQKISNAVHNNRDMNNWRLLGRALNQMRAREDLGLVYTFLTYKDLEECGVRKGEASGIANYLNLTLKDARIVLTLVEEEEGKIKGSLRTRDPRVDLTKIAAYFGGGGHRGASGFVIDGRIGKDPGDEGLISLT